MLLLLLFVLTFPYFVKLLQGRPVGHHMQGSPWKSGADDVMSPMLWTKLFLEAQGIDVKDNVLHQDNKSTILLAENGKSSSGKRTRALNIRFFFITDQISQGNLRVVYCPTKDMRGDYLTKPLQGALFHEHRAFIMGHDHPKLSN